MKQTLKLFLLGLLTAGVMTGCDKKDDTATTTTAEQTAAQTAAQVEPAVTAAQTAEQTAAQTAAQVDKELFIKAAFEVTCVRAKVADTETQKAILTEVFARYGFTEESFGLAETALTAETTVQEAIKSKMEACTPELAAKLKEAGADAAGATAVADPKEVKKPAKPAVAPGKYTGSVSGGGLEDAEIEITVKDDMTIYAKFNGKREGKKVLIPMKGTLAKDGAFTLSGEKGPNNLSATGRIKENTANGKMTGTINAKGLSVTFNAKS